MILKWTKEYSVNNEIIDAQHQKLFDIVNTLSRAISAGEGVDSLLLTLEEMSKYAWMHFRTEEDLLFKSNYQSLDDHKRLHEAFKLELMRMTREALQKQTIQQVAEVHQYLSEWLYHHVLQEDLQYKIQ